MRHNTGTVLPLEKIISIASYFTFGLVGMVWLIFSFLVKKQLRYFLMYNIIQSIIISLFLALFKITMDIILNIVSMIPFVDKIAAVINLFISLKVLNIAHFSFTIFEIFIYLLIFYICFGVILGRIFYVPLLTKLITKVMQRYS